MLEGARWRLGRGEYDLACFEAEQAAQLYIKSVLLRLVGEAPRIHGISNLMGRLYSALRDEYPDLAGEIADLSSSMRRQIWFLDESYFMGRYGPVDYDQRDGRECVETAEAIIELVDKVERVVAGG